MILKDKNEINICNIVKRCKLSKSLLVKLWIVNNLINSI